MKNKEIKSASWANVAAQVSTVLANNNIPQHKHRSHVAKALNISYPAARRLILGEVPWSEDDINAVLRTIGVEWDGYSLFQNMPEPDSAPIITTEMIADVKVDQPTHADADAAGRTIIDLVRRIDDICARESVILTASKMTAILTIAVKEPDLKKNNTLLTLLVHIAK